MSLWIRYDAIRGCWEVSPNEKENYFSDLIENHPRETTFGRWIEFEAFADAKNMGVYRQPEESFGGRRVKVFNDGDFLREIRKRRGRIDVWGPNQVNTPPAVAPAGRARIYFDKTTNRLKMSQNGGPWLDVVSSVLSQQDANTIPFKIVAPQTGSGGQPPNNFSGLTGWWKADAGVFSDAGSTPAVDGNTVQQWNDQSGGGFNLSQATAGFRPTYLTNVLNGKPVIRFGGATDDDYMTGPAISNFFSASAKTIFVVYKHSSNATCGIVGVVDSSNHVIVYTGTSGTVLHSYNNDGTPDDITKSGLSSGTYYIATYLHSGGTLYVGASDTRTASMSSGASGNTSALTALLSIGANSFPSANFLDGDIAEIIFFNEGKAEGDRQEVETYLASPTRYNVTLPYSLTTYGNVDLLRIEDNLGNEVFRISKAGDVYIKSIKLNVP